MACCRHFKSSKGDPAMNENCDLEQLKEQAMQALATDRLNEVLRLASLIFAREQALFGPADPRTASSLDNLAGAYMRVGRHTEAIEALKRALQILTQVGGNEKLK